MNLGEILDYIDGILWGTPFIVFVLVIGIYFSIRCKFFPVVHLGYVFKHTFGDKNANKGDEANGTISSFAAVCIAIGGTVGAGNLAGVATAMATGGPGALFWLLVWAFFGMTVKIVEVSLGCYYRLKDSDGKYYGGATFMIEEGLSWDQGHKWGVWLAMAFSVSLFLSWFAGSQAYSIAESINVAFGLNPIVFVILYAIFIFCVTVGGMKRVSGFCSKIVPFMCLAFVVGGIGIICINWQAIPGIIVDVFRNAFTPRSAIGGFAGCTVAEAMRAGIARSMNSNEAGQGTSPFVHGSANVEHPMIQGLWGAVEVFIDTVIVCTITSLAVLSTGQWTSGLKGATLTMAAYEQSFGQIGVWFIGLMALLFGLTTTSAWYTYDIVNIRYMLRNHPKAKEWLSNAWKFLFPIPNIVIVTTLTLMDLDATAFWAITDIALVLPVFFNLFALALLSGKFMEIFNDYKARYMGIGKIDPNFPIFYENVPGVKEKMAELDVKRGASMKL